MMSTVFMAFFGTLFGVVQFYSGDILPEMKKGISSGSHIPTLSRETTPTYESYDAKKMPLFDKYILQQLGEDMKRGGTVPKVSHPQIPMIGSRAYILGDPISGSLELSHKQHVSMPVGSLTKLMTALVALEHFDLDDQVIIPFDATKMEGAKLYLLSQDSISLRDLITATLVRSGNDGAYALAAHAPLGVDQFVGWMNEKAHMLGMDHSHFSNPMGFDAVDNYSSAYDLFILTRYLLETHPFLAEAVEKESYEFTTGANKHYKVQSTNGLFQSFLKIKGVKTGTTEGAGASFIGLAENEFKEKRLAIVLASPDRFQEAKVLLWWGLKD